MYTFGKKKKNNNLLITNNINTFKNTINENKINQNYNKNNIKTQKIIKQKNNITIEERKENLLNDRKSKYILKKIFGFLNKKTTFKIIKYNNELQKKINMVIKEYYFQIEIEIIPVEKSNDAINIFFNYFYDTSYYHVYFNDNEEEIKRNYYIKSNKIKKIKIILDYEIKSLSGLFRYCKCIKSINFIKCNRKDITDMREMFSRCSSLEEVDLSNLNINGFINTDNMFSECSEELKNKVKNRCTNLSSKAFEDLNYDLNNKYEATAYFP